MATLISILWIIVCALIQVVFFNHLNMYGGIVLIYLIALFKIPFQANRSVQIIIGFLCGLCIDIFSNTLGLHALACTTLMWLRIPVLHMFVIAEDVKVGIASFDKLGFSVYIRYVLTLTIIHTVMLWGVDSIALFNIIPFLLKIISTIILTSLFVFAFEFAISKQLVIK